MNACGVSGIRRGSGSFDVFDCATAPALGTPISINIPYRNEEVGYMTRAYITNTTDVPYATNYIWTLPPGLSAESLITVEPILWIKCEEEGSYPATGITVAAQSCGVTGAPVQGLASQTLVVSPRTKWGTVEGVSGEVYRTYDFGDAGLFMVDPSKEGVPAAYGYPGKEIGERGYYYGSKEVMAATPSVCPPDWVVPTHDDFEAIWAVATEPEKRNVIAPWETMAGRFALTSDGWAFWGTMTRLALHSTPTPGRPGYGFTSAQFVAQPNSVSLTYYDGLSTDLSYDTNLWSVKCIFK
jgi:hypothetical protein